MQTSVTRIGISVLCLVVGAATASSVQILRSSVEAIEDVIFRDGVEPSEDSDRPIAIAGADQNVPVGEPVALDGSASRDPRGVALQFRWVLEARPTASEAVLVEPFVEQPTIVPDVRGDYVIVLVVSDGWLDSAPDRLLVRAFDNFGVDSDGDGLGDSLEVSLGLDPYNEDSFGDGTLDANRDLDGDLLTIREELLLGLDPINPDSDGNGTNDGNEDLDRDGLDNRAELIRGTRPLHPDSDEDGWPDGAEVDGDSDPVDPQSRPRFTVVVPVGGHELVRVGLGDMAGSPLNTVTANPLTGHGLVRVGSGSTEGTPINVIVASPQAGHGLVRVGSGSTEGSPINVIVASPQTGHGLVRVGSGDTVNATLSSVIALPPATLWRQQ